MEILQATGNGKKCSKMKTRGLQPRVLYPASPSLKWKDKKGVPRQKKPQRIHLLQASSARLSKGSTLRKGGKTVRERAKKKKENRLTKNEEGLREMQENMKCNKIYICIYIYNKDNRRRRRTAREKKPV